MVEGARLERVYTAMYRRFESSRFRQEVKKTRKGIFYFFEEEARIRAQIRMERSDKEYRAYGILLNNLFTQP